MFTARLQEAIAEHSGPMPVPDLPNLLQDNTWADWHQSEQCLEGSFLHCGIKIIHVHKHARGKVPDVGVVVTPGADPCRKRADRRRCPDAHRVAAVVQTLEQLGVDGALLPVIQAATRSSLQGQILDLMTDSL